VIAEIQEGQIHNTAGTLLKGCPVAGIHLTLIQVYPQGGEFLAALHEVTILYRVIRAHCRDYIGPAKYGCYEY
jgi:hypothetical protein